MQTASSTLTPARELHRPRRISSRAAVGAFLALTATVASLYFWALTSQTRPVLVASRALAVGTTISPSDLLAVHVQVPDEMYEVAVPASQMATLIGKRVAEPVYAGEMLQRSELSVGARLGPNELAMTIAVSPETSAGDLVRPGDQVQMLLTRGEGEPGSTTEVLLPRVTVYNIGYAAGTAGYSPEDAITSEISQGSVDTLTVIVSQQDAVRLANAKWNGALDVALLASGSR